MTLVRSVANMLDREWQEDRPGRVVPVPKPKIHVEGEETRITQRTGDDIVVRDGGTTDPSANGLGWEREDVLGRVTINIYSANRREDGVRISGRERLFGYANTTDSVDEYGLEPDETEKLGGLQGEVRHLLNDKRRGWNNWDRVRTVSMNDVSSTMGANKHRSEISVEFDDIARSIP